MLDSRQLGSLQGFAAKTLDIAGCQVVRPASGSVGTFGQPLTTPATTLATVSCGLATPSSSELTLYAAQIGTARAWRAYLPSGTSVQRGDQLHVSGRVLTVAADLTLSSYSTLVVLLVTEVA